MCKTHCVIIVWIHCTVVRAVGCEFNHSEFEGDQGKSFANALELTVVCEPMDCLYSNQFDIVIKSSGQLVGCCPVFGVQWASMMAAQRFTADVQFSSEPVQTGFATNCAIHLGFCRRVLFILCFVFHIDCCQHMNIKDYFLQVELAVVGLSRHISFEDRHPWPLWWWWRSRAGSSHLPRQPSR